MVSPNLTIKNTFLWKMIEREPFHHTHLLPEHFFFSFQRNLPRSLSWAPDESEAQALSPEPLHWRATPGRSQSSATPTNTLTSQPPLGYVTSLCSPRNETFKLQHTAAAIWPLLRICVWERVLSAWFTWENYYKWCSWAMWHIVKKINSPLVDTWLTTNREGFTLMGWNIDF